MKKKFLSLLLSVALLLSFLPVASADAAQAPGLESSNAIIVDAATGERLWSKDADTVRPVASMTKVMASYLILEAINDGRITMDTPVPISTYTYCFSRDSVYSNIPFETDVTYTVRDMLNAFLCYSACAAGPALGELVYGSEEALTAAMNTKAQELGIDARFDQSYDEGYMSARAMATLSKQVIEECPVLLEITAQSTFTFNGRTYGSTNELLDLDDASIGDVDGIKTGWTPMAGSCLAATAVKDGHRIITVTMGALSVKVRRFCAMALKFWMSAWQMAMLMPRRTPQLSA